MSAISAVLVASAALVALVAAVRSTWSPCGTSMLATVTPLAEQGRGHRYRATASWFVVGSVSGGATLGLGMAALAAAVRAVGVGATGSAILALVACLVAAAADSELAGFRVPIHRRQVNERWLDQFRPWVYGAGFGWQIGVGVATYIKTAAVYLTIVLAALAGEPGAALGIGLLFGLTRGLAVFWGRRITTPAALAHFHHRFTELDPAALALVLAGELAAALVCSATLAPWAPLPVVVAWATVALGRSRSRTRRTSAPVGGTTPS